MEDGTPYDSVKNTHKQRADGSTVTRVSETMVVFAPLRAAFYTALNNQMSAQSAVK
jgi:hypothetical protein